MVAYNAGMKKTVIEAIYNHYFDAAAQKEISTEYSIKEEDVERLVKAILDKVLVSPDIIAFLSEALGIYPVTQADERRAEYIG